MVGGRNKSRSALILAMALGATGLCRAEEKGKDNDLDDKLQIGGQVSLDQTSGLNMTKNPDLSVGQVALGANVEVTKELQASVLLRARGELDKIYFYQAMASLKPAGTPWSFLFGQQTFNHGLLATRLISDPDILPSVEITRPGATASLAMGDFTPGLGGVVLSSELETGTSKDYAAIPNLDWQKGPLLVRASGILSRFTSDADAALSLAVWHLQADAEAFQHLQVWDAADRSGGYYLGLEFHPTDLLSFAIRHDGMTSGNFSAWESSRYGAGFTLTFKHDLFGAFEYAYRDARATGSDQQIAIQVGMKSTLVLPGFQRKTLTQD